VAVNSIFNYDVSAGIEVVTASDGTVLPIGDLAQVLGYDGSNNLTTVTVVFNTKTYIQTLTYTSGNLTGVSKFVVQP
jgi:hypothetical protein